MKGSQQTAHAAEIAGHHNNHQENRYCYHSELDQPKKATLKQIPHPKYEKGGSTKIRRGTDNN